MKAILDAGCHGKVSVMASHLLPSVVTHAATTPVADYCLTDKDGLTVHVQRTIDPIDAKGSTFQTAVTA